MTRGSSIVVSVALGIAIAGAGDALIGPASSLHACASQKATAASVASSVRALSVFFPGARVSPFGVTRSSLVSSGHSVRCAS